MKFGTNILDTYNIETRVKCFVLASILHKNKAITDEKLKGLFKSYHNDSFTFKNTYHCNIQDKWFHDMSMTDILKDACDNLCTVKTIELPELLVYVNKLISKNRNYCIDWVFYNIIKPYLKGLDENNIYYFKNKLNSIGLEVNLYDKDNIPTFGYCCEDCDGDIDLFLSYRMTDYVIKPNRELIQNGVKNKLLSLRKRHTKIVEPEWQIF